MLGILVVCALFLAVLVPLTLTESNCICVRSMQSDE